MHKSKINVLAVVTIYISFTNRVDGLNHMKATNPILRRERCVLLSILSFLLNSPLQNACTVHNEIPGNIMTVCDIRLLAAFGQIDCWATRQQSNSVYTLVLNGPPQPHFLFPSISSPQMNS